MRIFEGECVGRGLDKGRGVAAAYLSDPPLSLSTSSYALLPILHPSPLPLLAGGCVRSCRRCADVCLTI